MEFFTNNNCNQSKYLARMFYSLVLGIALSVILGGSAYAQITNPIVAENRLPGNPPSQWQIADAGDSTIQGYATDISVTNGGTLYFKINTSATAYTIKIYRLGYYQGNGARLIASINPSAKLPQSQPAPITDSTTGLIDYGNWAVSAAWQVPTNAVSGVYFAKLTRSDTGGASQIVFIVRNDSSTSDILFKTSDTTWQAYNAYGGNSLYVGGPVGRAYKVSYNRPFITASPTAGGTSGNTEHDWLFNAEYPMIRWLEANGYNVTYTTGLDADRQPGALLLQHHLITSLGHDEYWSGMQRTNFENALAAGVNLAFFSGNEMSWKIRWEPSIDGSNTPYRTMVCYKESLANAKIDPNPTWTGYWRDPRFSPPADGGRPENRLTGTLSVVNDSGTSYTMQVPAQYSANRFWRNTTIASLPKGGTGNLGGGTLGYEWDVAPDNGFRPPGLMLLSSTSVTNVPVLQGDDLDYETDVATHNLTLYRAPSGAFVFGAGTCQWSWGLDTNHYDSYSSSTPAISVAMQQATVNLFADMGVQPATLQAGLVAATASTDHTPPTVTILTPASGGTISLGTPTLITGTASDVGGHVAVVEVSSDGGTTWHPATGSTNWTYTWMSPQAGTETIMCRASDDSGNLASPVSGPTFTVVGSVGTLWPGTAIPNVIDSGPDNSVELGVKFRSDISGYVTGVRFYKASANTGTHVGNLWTSSGTRLATATFTSETSSGWQQVNFSTPVNITSNTIYVASCHVPTGHYSEDDGYFEPAGVDNPPLHAPSSTEAGMAGGLGVGNDVYAYGANSTFPTNVWDAGNYWVDVVFATNTSAPVITTTLLPNGIVDSSYSATLAASGGKTPYTWSINSGKLPSGLTLNTATGAINGTPTNAGTFSFTAKVSDAGTPAKTATNELSITISPLASLFTIWPGSATPVVADDGPDSPVELGVKFRSDVAGAITGIRFYKAAANTGTHVANLWSTNGTLLASAMFTNESASGWQLVNFGTPVSIKSNIVYLASYHCNIGHYSEDDNFFASTGVDNPPLHALANGEAGGNGVYGYGASSSFPTNTYLSANYWVDVTFSSNAVANNAVANNTIPVISAPQIQSIIVQNGVAIITWSSMSNEVYQLQSCVAAYGTNWVNVSQEVQATGPTVTATNAVNGLNQQFYRVMVVPSP